MDRVGQTLDILDRRAGNSSGDFFPVEAVAAPGIARPRHEQREMERGPASHEAAFQERQIAERIHSTSILSRTLLWVPCCPQGGAEL